MSDKESDNYYRLIRLVVKTGTRTVREVFKKHIAHDIASVLKSHWKNIEKLKSKRVLTEPQYQLLNADTPDIEEFDISLLCILIRNICTNVETPTGTEWETVIVPSSDTTVGGYIIGIRNVRNKVVGHLSDTRVSNKLFKQNWAEAEKCLKGLAAHVGILDEIAKEIKNTESMLLTADSNTKLEATLKKWGVEELYTSLGQLHDKAGDQAKMLQKTMDAVSSIKEMIEGGKHTGKSGSANQQTAPVVNKFMLIVNKEMDQTKDVLENDYHGVCEALGIYPTQQQTKALPPIDNPNALTDDEIIKYSKQLDARIVENKNVLRMVRLENKSSNGKCNYIVKGKDWELFAIYLGYKQTQIDQVTATYPKQIQNLLRIMLQKWHDVVARCENVNPRDLLAASFSSIGDNRTAVDVLGDRKRLKDVKEMKPSPETKTKIEDIHFDVPSLTQIMHVVHHLGPSFESRKRALEEQQQPGIERSNAPNSDDVE